MVSQQTFGAGFFCDKKHYFIEFKAFYYLIFLLCLF